MNRSSAWRPWLALIACLVSAASAMGQVVPRTRPVSEKAFRHPDLYVPERTESLKDLDSARGRRAAAGAREVRRCRGVGVLRRARRPVELADPQAAAAAWNGPGKPPGGAGPRAPQRRGAERTDLERPARVPPGAPAGAQGRPERADLDPARGDLRQGQPDLRARAARRRWHPGARQLDRRRNQPRQPDPARPPEVGRRRRAPTAVHLGGVGARRGARPPRVGHVRRVHEGPAPRVHPDGERGLHRLSAGLGRELQGGRRHGHLGRARGRVQRDAVRLRRPEPVRPGGQGRPGWGSDRRHQRGRIPDQQRPVPSGRRRAARLADVLRRLHDRRRQALHGRRRQRASRDRSRRPWTACS